MKLEEYQTAKETLEIGASLAPGESRFTRLINECDEHITSKILLFELNSWQFAQTLSIQESKHSILADLLIYFNAYCIFFKDKISA